MSESKPKDSYSVSRRFFLKSFGSSAAVAATAQVEAVAAELEKANARMLLGIRQVMTPDQWTKLKAMREERERDWGGREGRGMRNNRGPGAPGGPSGDGAPGTPGPPPQME